MSAGEEQRGQGARAANLDEEGGAGLPAFLLDPKGVLARRWRWMLLALLAGAVASGVAAAVWPQKFLAQATVLITSQQIPQDFVRSTVREDSIANINAMAGKVFAQDSLVRVVKEKKLFSELQGKVEPGDLARRMLGNIGFARVSDFSSRSGRTQETSIIYGISFTSEDPLRAAEVANTLAALFVEASISRRNEQARRTTDFLRRELERDERELRENNSRITEFRSKHRGVLPNELDANSRKLDTLSSRRQSLSADIAAREARIASLTALPSEAAPSPNEVLLEEMRRELARQLAVNTEEHPNVIAIRGRVERLEELVNKERTSGRALSPNVRRLIDTEKNEINNIRAQVAQIDAEIDQLEKRVEQTPKTGEELASLEERGTVLREDYLGTLRKVEAAELAENLESAQQGSQVSLLDPAVPPRAPEVSRWLVAAGGLGASLALALALAVLLELVDPVLISNRQLEEIAELPVLGSLPRIA
jgi:uncharacterized protein involved in exopolysaccharide biosynthesis